jgi:hypothetical protein
VPVGGVGGTNDHAQRRVLTVTLQGIEQEVLENSKQARGPAPATDATSTSSACMDARWSTVSRRARIPSTICSILVVLSRNMCSTRSTSSRPSSPTVRFSVDSRAVDSRRANSVLPMSWASAIRSTSEADRSRILTALSWICCAAIAACIRSRRARFSSPRVASVPR